MPEPPVFLLFIMYPPQGFDAWGVCTGFFLRNSTRSIRLYSKNVMAETTAPFKRFSGATAYSTSVETLWIAPLISLPIATMASSGIP